MLRSEAITIIKRGLGFRQTQDAAIVAALKQAQRDLKQGKSLPEWLLKTVTLPVVDGVATLPDDFLRLPEEYPPYYLNTDNAKVWVPRKNPIEATEAYTDRSDTYPHVMVIRSNTMILVPTPTTVPFTMYLTYYAAAQPLDSDIENLWLANAANYLVGLAGVFVAGDLRDSGAASKFSMMAKAGAQSYLGNVVDDELMGRPLIMGRNN